MQLWECIFSNYQIHDEATTSTCVCLSLELLVWKKDTFRLLSVANLHYNIRTLKVLPSLLAGIVTLEPVP